jgi:hypothetical protein
MQNFTASWKKRGGRGPGQPEEMFNMVEELPRERKKAKKIM